MQRFTILVGQQRNDRLQRRLAVLGRNICHQTSQRRQRLMPVIVHRATPSGHP